MKRTYSVGARSKKSQKKKERTSEENKGKEFEKSRKVGRSQKKLTGFRIKENFA